jgi:hypothetical protein
MALTDTEIRKARAKVKTYRISDSGGLYLLVTPAGGNSGAGSIDSTGAKS